MSDAKFTPGPWFHGDKHPHEEIRYVESAPGLQDIATLYLHVYLHDDEQKANAQLIAAAPDLYDFAAEFVEAWEIGMGGDSSLLKKARAALAKARGEA